MKKLIYVICMGAAVAFSSCEDMLDTTNYTEKTTATFPESYDDAPINSSYPDGLVTLHR